MRGNKLQESFLAVSAAILAAFYAIMGMMFMLYPAIFVGFPPNTRVILGTCLILYGGFRGYRAYKRWVDSK